MAHPSDTLGSPASARRTRPTSIRRRSTGRVGVPRRRRAPRGAAASSRNAPSSPFASTTARSQPASGWNPGCSSVRAAVVPAPRRRSSVARCSAARGRPVKAERGHARAGEAEHREEQGQERASHQSTAAVQARLAMKTHSVAFRSGMFESTRSSRTAPRTAHWAPERDVEPGRSGVAGVVAGRAAVRRVLGLVGPPGHCSRGRRASHGPRAQSSSRIGPCSRYESGSMRAASQVPAQPAVRRTPPPGRNPASSSSTCRTPDWSRQTASQR